MTVGVAASGRCPSRVWRHEPRSATGTIASSEVASASQLAQAEHQR